MSCFFTLCDSIRSASSRCRKNGAGYMCMESSMGILKYFDIVLARGAGAGRGRFIAFVLKHTRSL